MARPYGAIRAAQAADTDRVVALLNEAFTVPPTPGMSPDDLDLRGCWVLDGAYRVDATATTMDVPQWINGHAVASRAIAGVAVASDRRGDGAGRALMTQVLTRCAEEGAAIASLYPTTIGFYRSLGFDVAGYYVAGKVTIGDLPALRATAVEVVDKPELEALTALYDAAVNPLAGPLVRPDWWWDRRVFDRAHPGKRWTVIVRDGSDIAGYAVLSKGPGESHGPNKHRVSVHDTAWRDADAARELLGYLHGFVSLGDDVRWPSPPGDHWLHELTGRGPAPAPSTHPWMLRILDVPAALSSRGWPATAKGQLVIEVSDDLLEGNRGRWQVTIDGPVAAVTSTTAPADLVLGASGLAAAYTGWRTISDLVRHGLAVVAANAALPTYDAWFAARPWMGERF